MSATGHGPKKRVYKERKLNEIRRGKEKKEEKGTGGNKTETDRGKGVKVKNGDRKPYIEGRTHSENQGSFS